jgi:hypothetical protein
MKSIVLTTCLCSSLCILAIKIEVQAAPPGYSDDNRFLKTSTDQNEGFYKNVGLFSVASRGCRDNPATATVENNWNSGFFWDLDGTNKKCYTWFNVRKYTGCGGGGVQVGVKKDKSSDPTYDYAKKVSQVSPGKVVVARARQDLVSGSLRQSVSIHVLRSSGKWVGDIFVNWGPNYGNSSWPQVRGFTADLGVSVDGSSMKFRAIRANKNVFDSNFPGRMTFVILPESRIASNQKLRVDIGKLCRELQFYCERDGNLSDNNAGNDWGYRLSDYVTNAGVSTEHGGDAEGNAEFLDLRIDSL